MADATQEPISFGNCPECGTFAQTISGATGQIEYRPVESNQAAVFQDDVAALLEAVGLRVYARPMSPHRVVLEEIIPAIKRLRAALQPLPSVPTETRETQPKDRLQLMAERDTALTRLREIRARLGVTEPPLTRRVIALIRTAAGALQEHASGEREGRELDVAADKLEAWLLLEETLR